MGRDYDACNGGKASYQKQTSSTICMKKFLVKIVKGFDSDTIRTGFGKSYKIHSACI